MKSNKKGFTFIEVLITLLVITTISLIVQQTAFIMMLKSQSSIMVEANRLAKSFVTEGKALCLLNPNRSPWIYSDNASLSPNFPGHKINGNTDVNVEIKCERVGSSNLKRVDVLITIPSLNKEVTGKGFVN